MFAIWPMDNSVEGDARNVPDEILTDVWERMVAEGKDKRVFYRGSVTTLEQWMTFIKARHNYPLFVVDDEDNRVVTVAWANNYNEGTIHGHFCTLGRYRDGIGEKVLEYWKALPDPEGGQLVRVVYGITPTSKGVVKFLKRIGFTALGEIPEFIKVQPNGGPPKRVSGTLVYKLL